MSRIKRIAAFILVFILVLSVGIVGINAADKEVADVSAASDTAGITVYFKSEDVVPYIYYWNALPQNLETQYPGVKMTLDSTQYGGNWYKYTFKAFSLCLNLLLRVFMLFFKLIIFINKNIINIVCCTKQFFNENKSASGL